METLLSVLLYLNAVAVGNTYSAAEIDQICNAHDPVIVDIYSNDDQLDAVVSEHSSAVDGIFIPDDEEIAYEILIIEDDGTTTTIDPNPAN